MRPLIATVAGKQHGLVTRRQLLDAGLGDSAIKRRVRGGLLLVEHPGVYRVGHAAPSLEATYLAAILACGPGSVLRGRAAAHQFGLVRGRPPVPEVLTTGRTCPSGVRTTRTRRIELRDVTTWRSIPTTTVPRTLVDLAAVLSIEDLGRACHEAQVRHRVGPPEIEAVVARRPNAPGAGRLAPILRGDERVVLSRLEARFLERLRRALLPLPHTNRRVGGRYVDCRWLEPPLTVEVDGYRYHGSRHAWEQDRRREREAYARGDEFRRFTYGDVFEDPRLMLAELEALLGPSPLRPDR